VAEGSVRENDLRWEGEEFGKAITETGSESIPVGSGHRVLLIDKSKINRECLAYALRGRVSDLAVSCVADVAEVYGRTDLDPAAIMLALNDTCVEDARPIVEDLKGRYPAARLLLLADRDDAQSARTAIREGLGAFVPTTLSFEVLVAVLRLVLAGGVFIPVELMTALASEPPPANSSRGVGEGADDPSTEPFTERELEVLNALRQGKPNKIIAHELEIAVSTVKVHIRNIMKKLNATNRTQVVLRTRVTATTPNLESFATG
jgi:DNA-binding NarL/FixJ family response regulator